MTPEKELTGFLCLELKPGQKLRIGDGVEVAISKVTHSRVRLAIRAPGLKVTREINIREQRGVKPNASL